MFKKLVKKMSGGRIRENEDEGTTAPAGLA